MGIGPEERPNQEGFMDIRDQVEHSEEMKGYMQEFQQRILEFTRRAAVVPPNSKGSVEWLGRIGKFWWQARENQGLSRYEVAEKLGVPVNQIRFLEFGMPTPNELRSLTDRYAEALGQPDLSDQFCKTFNLPKLKRRPEAPNQKP